MRYGHMVEKNQIDGKTKKKNKTEGGIFGREGEREREREREKRGVVRENRIWIVGFRQRKR